ncbi:MAG: S9 family peptidase, partial [Chloroflexota bacterium]
MTTRNVAPYGAWESPITAGLIVSKTMSLGAITLDGSQVYWLEARPTEGGRQVLVCLGPDDQITDLTPAPFNVRTRVHEYGGGSYLVHEGVVYFANFADQRLYRLAGDEAQPLTPAVDLRYADAMMDARRGRLIAVREDHTQAGPQAVNTLISLDVNGDEAGGRVLVEGADFYSSPRLSPDGRRLAWLAWHHPNMPWDGTELWVADVTGDGSLANATLVAGGPAESIFQPEWSPGGRLAFVSDRTDWWNLYHWRDGQIEPLCPLDAEFGQPQWVFGQSTYAYVTDNQIVCTYNQNGISYLALLEVSRGQLQPIELPYTQIGQVRVADGRAVFAAASATIEPCIVELDLNSYQTKVLRRASQLNIAPGYISV